MSDWTCAYCGSDDREGTPDGEVCWECHADTLCATCGGSGVVEEIEPRFHREISWYGRHPADAVDVPCPDCEERIE